VTDASPGTAVHHRLVRGQEQVLRRRQAPHDLYQERAQGWRQLPVECVSIGPCPALVRPSLLTSLQCTQLVQRRASLFLRVRSLTLVLTPHVTTGRQLVCRSAHRGRLHAHQGDPPLLRDRLGFVYRLEPRAERAARREGARRGGRAGGGEEAQLACAISTPLAGLSANGAALGTKAARCCLVDLSRSQTVPDSRSQSCDLRE